MRWQAGPTLAERVTKINESRTSYFTQWHPFYCLIPRRVGQEIVWLETIQRKGRFEEGHGYASDQWTWEYRVPMATLIAEDWARRVSGPGIKEYIPCGEESKEGRQPCVNEPGRWCPIGCCVDEREDPEHRTSGATNSKSPAICRTADA